MTIWVVGGGGTLGNEVCRLLTELELPHIGTGSHEVDIRDADRVAAFADQQRPTHIFNCAAFTDVDGAETQREQAAAVNERGVGNLVSSARLNDATLVHISTDYVFAGDATEPYSEDDLCRPLNAYGATKRAGERIIENAIGGFERSAAAVYLVRTSWLFGPQGRDFVGRMLRLLQERDEVEIVADQTGRPTYAPDLARALSRLAGLTGPAAPSGFYHFANAGEATWYDVTQTIAVLSGARCRITPIETADLGRAARRPTYSVLSTAKLTRATGIEPRSWVEALGECLEHLRLRRSR